MARRHSPFPLSLLSSLFPTSSFPISLAVLGENYGCGSVKPIWVGVSIQPTKSCVFVLGGTSISILPRILSSRKPPRVPCVHFPGQALLGTDFDPRDKLGRSLGPRCGGEKYRSPQWICIFCGILFHFVALKGSKKQQKHVRRSFTGVVVKNR